MPPRIWIDADGCPNEIKLVAFRASHRLGLAAFLVANVPLAADGWPRVTTVCVSHAFNAADDHIAENAAAGDVVVTADIPLAARVVERGSVAISPRGEVYDESNVGHHLATRNLMQDLRAAGAIQGGPAPIRPGDKARFAAALDRTLTKLLKGAPPRTPRCGARPDPSELLDPSRMEGYNARRRAGGCLAETLVIGCTKLLCGTATIADLMRADAGQRPHLLQFTTEDRPLVVWNTTRRCNLACAHCYLDARDRAGRDELTTDEARSFIADIAAMRCPVLLFSGGEPLQRPDVFDLGRFAIQQGLRAVLSSNGTLITPEVARQIADVGFSYVGVSIDGTAATHDELRRKKGALDAALTGIQNCLAAGVKAGIRFTLNRRNAADLDAVLDLVETHGVPRFCLYHLVYAGRGREMVNDDLEPADTRRIIEHLLDRTKDWHRRGIATEVLTTDNHADGILIEQRLAAEAPGRLADVRELLARHGGCSAGTKMANVDARGNVHPCQFWSHVTLGNVRQRPFSAIWTDQTNGLLAMLRRKAEHLKGPRCSCCRYNALCGGCRIRAEVVHGDPWADDPACFLTDQEIRRA